MEPQFGMIELYSFFSYSNIRERNLPTTLSSKQTLIALSIYYILLLLRKLTLYFIVGDTDTSFIKISIIQKEKKNVPK